MRVGAFRPRSRCVIGYPARVTRRSLASMTISAEEGVERNQQLVRPLEVSGLSQVVADVQGSAFDEGGGLGRR